MFFERILAEGLMQYSYFFGDNGHAFVIDPTYDVDIYLELANKHQAVITDIFETHRNEDLLLGSKHLADLTGAKVHISQYEELGYQYGERIGEEHHFKIGDDLLLKPLHTPGHTRGHLSYALYFKGKPYMVFTGDALFYGGVGRSDFYGEAKLDEMTTLLYQSIYEKLAKLGEHVLVMPAHGPGSACGDDMDHRPYSTIGYELQNSDALSADLNTFKALNAKMQYKNHAFETMEVGNVRGGGTTLQSAPYLREWSSQATIVDIRPRRAFMAQHLPGSLCMPAELLNTYLGWFVVTDSPIVLMADGVCSSAIELAQRGLFRQGFNQLEGLLGESTLFNYASAGNSLSYIQMISSDDYLALTEGTTLDVRKKEELLDEDPVINRINIPYQELKNRVIELGDCEHLYVLCASGERATVAAAWLQSEAGLHITVVEGGMMGLQAAQAQ